MITHMGGKQPHESYAGWEDFLERACEVHVPIGEGVMRHSSANCHFIVWPDGTLYECFGFHAGNVARRINEEGAEKVRQDLIGKHKRAEALLRLMRGE